MVDGQAEEERWMDDTVKENSKEKKGKKGMVVVISVAKPQMKNPVSEADPDTKEKAEHGFCDCCSPIENAFAMMKAKKKSKPFHGYNPKRHHKKGGLNAAGRAKFKRETGANLKPPVTTKPSKLKPGSKRAKRRKSFCARMSGMKGPTSKKGKMTPKGAALKRWNC